MPLVFLCQPGNFIIAMLLSQVFALSDTLFGLIVSLPYWANVLQLVAIPLLSQRWSQKRITLTFAWLNIACWFALAAALPYIPINNPDVSGRILFWIFLAGSLTFSIVAVSWMFSPTVTGVKLAGGMLVGNPGGGLITSPIATSDWMKTAGWPRADE